VTLSAGVAALQSEQAGASVDHLLSMADRRLYIAKMRRNRVVADDAGNVARHRSTPAPLSADV
jgi:PleD family two-component response regulator